MNTPVTPYVLAGRILSIIGMGFFAASAILLAIIPSWWALVAAAAFFPFLGLIVLVERYQAAHGMIGPELPVTEDEGDE
ncbi:MAG: hypothetical protein IT303_00645 [Dehalococcoidia bacterium]|nr:hypothetical protein [Dehalococcoidia bacterium]